MFYLTIFGMIILAIEGITELFVNTESIVHKWFVKICNLNIVPTKIGDFYLGAAKCGFCFSLHTSISVNTFWLFTNFWYLYPFFVLSSWRLANLYHTIYSWLMRVKMFTGGKIG
jgi:hypothetical protein